MKTGSMFAVGLTLAISALDASGQGAVTARRTVPDSQAKADSLRRANAVPLDMAPMQTNGRGGQGGAVGAIGRGAVAMSQLPTKTFELHYLSPNAAVTLLKPYMRTPGGGPSLVGGLKIVTVQETPTVLAEVEKVITQFDRAPASVVLTFQLISADTGAFRDPAIVGLDSVLRSVLRFTGYHLAGRAYGSAMEGSTFSTSLDNSMSMDPLSPASRSGNLGVALTTTVRAVIRDGASTYANLDVRLAHTMGEHSLEAFMSTEVNVPIGQTIVLGTAGADRNGATILTVRVDIAK